MKKHLLFLALMFLSSAPAASAQPFQFNQWYSVSEQEKDPFSDSRETKFVNLRDLSGRAVVLSCQQGEGELVISVSSGFKSSDIPAWTVPYMGFAFDGAVFFKDREAALSVNAAGYAMGSLTLKGEEALQFTEKMQAARRIIAARDGIGAATQDYSVIGVSKAGRELQKCLLKG